MNQTACKWLVTSFQVVSLKIHSYSCSKATETVQISLIDSALWWNCGTAAVQY